MSEVQAATNFSVAADRVGVPLSCDCMTREDAMAGSTGAREEYARRQEQWQAELQVSERLFIQIGNWRLALGVAEAVLAWLVFGSRVLPGWVLALPVAAFVVLAAWHGRIGRSKIRSQRALRFYASGMARLEDRWTGSGSSGEQFCDAEHVYAEDLDLFGKGSLFELISTARTEAGERRLADWLRSPADRDEAAERQQAVRELSERLNLREELALLGEDARAELHEKELDEWGAAAPVRYSAALRPIALMLSILGPAALLAFLAGAIPLWPFAIIFGLDAALAYRMREPVRRMTARLETPAHSLRILSLIMERLEGETFGAPALVRLREQLSVNGVVASRQVQRLERWVAWFDSSDHLLVRVLRSLLLWREQIAMGIENWRRKNGQFAGRWLGAVAQFEALSSLASLAYERPEWTFPELIKETSPAFEAEGMKHPLIASARSVANDVALGGGLRLMIVSGSNMSGKSTLLRAIGLNTVLAWAGGPVAAARLRISPLQTGASIRVNDSLQDNRSRFFAEITRLRELLALARGGRPLLFLLDELLSGTNSHDRRLGAAGILKKLVERGAIGLVTTHDLALAEIEAELGGSAENLHFEDQLTGSVIQFDYQLRPGVVTRSNALALMRAVGIDI